MAVTVTAVGSGAYDGVVGSLRKTVSTVAFDSSYPTGGEPLTAADLRLGRVAYADVTISTTATTTVNATQFAYDVTNSKLLVFDETPAEVSNTANLDGLVVQIEAYGYV